MIKADLVERVIRETGLGKNEARLAVDAFIQALKEALLAGERVELRGFGVFVVKDRKRGVGRNPRTGVQVPLPPGKTVRFKPGKALRDLEL